MFRLFLSPLVKPAVGVRALGIRTLSGSARVMFLKPEEKAQLEHEIHPTASTTAPEAEALRREARAQPGVLPRISLKKREEPTPLSEAFISKHRILKRMPKFMLPYAQRFANAPYSHVFTFVMLHELSAIVPLMGLWYLFNRFDFVPVNFAPTWAIEHGADMLKNYVDVENGIFKYWAVVDKGKIIVQGANAYAITKMLMPLRVMASAALTPVVSRWFVEPWGKIFRAIFGSSGKRKSIRQTQI